MAAAVVAVAPLAVSKVYSFKDVDAAVPSGMAFLTAELEMLDEAVGAVPLSASRWATKTPAEIREDISLAISHVWGISRALGEPDESLKGRMKMYFDEINLEEVKRYA